MEPNEIKACVTTWAPGQNGESVGECTADEADGVLEVVEARQDGTVGLSLQLPDGSHVEAYILFPDLVRAVMSCTSEEG